MSLADVFPVLFVIPCDIHNYNPPLNKIPTPPQDTFERVVGLGG
jgi:hypothetical protein